MNTNSIEFLQHYGVLGMKWGVRRGRKGQKYRTLAKNTQSPKNVKRSNDDRAREIRSTGNVVRLQGIEKAMSKGSSYKKAKLMESGKSFISAALGGAPGVAALDLARYKSAEKKGNLWTNGQTSHQVDDKIRKAQSKVTTENFEQYILPKKNK